MEGSEINPGPLGEAQGVFVGNFTHLLDPKKRLTIPAEWREHVGTPNSLYVLPDVENGHYLLVFPAREMVRRLQAIRSHSISDTRARQFTRILGSQSQLAPWDTAGRIRVNDDLLGYGNLSDSVVLAGAFDHFELWSPERWKSVRAAGAADLGEAARYVGF
jgi:MraZ protein